VESVFSSSLQECSGLADPGPLARLFWVDEELESDVYLDGIIGLVDAVHLESHLRGDKKESV
jgi:G3E family GTPase